MARLSGGERRRLQLLRVLASEPNVLLLDEPTNDLDTDTLAALEDLLDSWAGTLIVVSHDRYLVERVADTVLSVAGDGTVLHRPGGVDQYLADRRAALAASGGTAGGRGSDGAAGGSGGSRAPVAGLSSEDLRQWRKDLQRLDKRMESLRRKQVTLHERLAAVGADYETATALNTELREVAAELETAELEWLETAERLEA